MLVFPCTLAGLTILPAHASEAFPNSRWGDKPAFKALRVWPAAPGADLKMRSKFRLRMSKFARVFEKQKVLAGSAAFLTSRRISLRRRAVAESSADVSSCCYISRNGCCCKLGVRFEGVLVIRALLFGVHTRAPECLQAPKCQAAGSEPLCNLLPGRGRCPCGSCQRVA